MEPNAQQSRSARASEAVRVSAVIAADAQDAPSELGLRSVLAEDWVDELIVVDRGTTAEVASRLRALKADRRDVMLLAAPPAATLGEARNYAAAAARGAYLLFLDANVVLRRGAVEGLLNAGRGAASPWLAGAKVVDPRGHERPGARAGVPTLGSALIEAAGLRAAPPPMGDAPALVEAIGGAAMLAPREDFLALGGFDAEDLFPFDAVDLCRRAAAAGGEVRYAPQAEALQFDPPEGQVRRSAGPGLARFLAKAARTRLEGLAAAMIAPLVRLVAQAALLAPRPRRRPRRG